MSIAEKLTTIAENQQKVYEAGKQAEYDRFWDNYQQNGERTNYTMAFSGACWNEESLTPKYIIRPTDATGMCQKLCFKRSTRMDMTDFCKKLDLSQCTILTSAFADACVENLTIDASNVTNVSYAFQTSGASNLGIENLTLTVTEKCTNYTNAFINMYHIERLVFTSDSVIASSVSFKNSRLLTHESIQSIINALSDTTSGLTLTLSKTAVNTAFGIDVDDLSTWGEESEFYNLRHSKDNWTISYI